MRILLGLQEVSGHYCNLLKGFRKLGIECDFIQQTTHNFKYEDSNEGNLLLKLWQKVGTIRFQTPRKRIVKKILILSADYVLRTMVFIFALIKYDIMIFSFGMSFFDSELELWIYKKFRKKIIFAFHGSDSRPPYLDGFIMTPDNKTSVSDCRKRTLRIKKKIEKIDKYATYVVNAVSQSYFHNRKVVNFFIIGLPYERNENHFIKNEKRDDVIALHCPSNRTGKGTQEIIDAVSRLNDKGLKIKLKLLEGIPNEQVIKEIQNCDFVIDQLYSDTALAGFATEAAYFGKPAVVGGYFVHEINKYIPKESIPPSYCQTNESPSNNYKIIFGHILYLGLATF